MSLPPYVFDAAHEVVLDYAEYSGMPLPGIVACLSDFRRLNREEWEALPGSWADRAERFYALSRNYIFDLLRGHPSRRVVLENLQRFEPRIMENFRGHAGRTFLDFGGGTGVFCQIMAELGKEVTYADLAGPVSDFAAWRFQKLGLKVERVVSEPRALRLPRGFDLIFSDAVFEHLIDPLRSARELAGHLLPGGFMGLLVDLEGENPDMPMHRNVDIVALHRVLEGSGLSSLFGFGTFASGWCRPSGAPGVSG